MKKMIWGIACLTCCAFLLSSASAFADTVQLTPDPAGDYWSIVETQTTEQGEYYYAEDIQYDFYNNSSMSIDGFAVGVMFEDDWMIIDDVIFNNPENWDVALVTREAYDNSFGDWDEIFSEYEYAFVAYTENSPITAYTGRVGEFGMEAGWFMMASPAVVHTTGGQLYTGQSSHDPNNIIRNPLGGSPAPVPEPATMLLFGTGLAGLVGMRRRKAEK